MRAFLSYHTRRDVAAQTCPIQDDPENGGGGVDILERDARLVRMYRATGIVKLKAYRRRRFPSKYTGQDITLLAEVDRAHERLSGRATVFKATRPSAVSIGERRKPDPQGRPGFLRRVDTVHQGSRRRTRG